MNKSTWAQVLLPLGAIAVVFPWASAGTALLLGAGAALTLGNPYHAWTRAWASRLLSIAVIGLGAGMDLRTVARVGAHGFVYTLVGIALTLALGMGLGRLLRVERTIAILVAVGTAICGGSAIAAVAPVVRAKSHEISVALGTVFVLNAVALFIFPPMGHALELTQAQFGLWSGLAIHDTSSVVGATSQYGAEALGIGTTVKLARALWIVPVTLFIGALQRRRDGTASSDTRRTKHPWFILGFIGMAAVVTYLPQMQQAGLTIEMLAKRLMVVTLFAIGSSLTRETLRSVGPRPLLQGVILWAIAAGSTLAALHWAWISSASV